MSIAIKVENLSKAYQLGEIGTGTLSRDLERWLAKVRGKEDPSFTGSLQLMALQQIIQKEAELMSAGQNKNAGQGACPVGGSIFLFLNFGYFFSRKSN